MYRVHLTEEQRQERQRRTHAPGIMPRTRDRLERVRLADAGWSIPKMARHFGRSEARVRYWIKRSLAHGFAALADQPHVGQPSRLTPALLATLRQELEKGERTWSAAQLAAWLAEHHGVQLSARHGGRLLQRARLSYKRTERGLNHKRHPQQVQEKQTELVAREKGAKPVAWTSAL